jgi:hypothetical protein
VDFFFLAGDFSSFSVADEEIARVAALKISRTSKQRRVGGGTSVPRSNPVTNATSFLHVERAQ